MKNIFRILILAVLFTACDETEPKIFNPVSGQTLATFGALNSDLPVVIDGVGEVTLQVNSTTLSSSDRVVNISVDTEASSANAENYTVPTSVVIPANQHVGTFTVSGVDNSVEIDVETIVLNMDSIEGGGQITESVHTISLFQICPVPETFLVGDYLITDNTTTATPNFGTDAAVTISIPDDNVNARTFVTTFLPTTGVARDVDVTIDLLCNLFVLNTIDINVTCTQDTSFIVGGVTLADSSMYDLTDDTSVIVNYLEDIEADCGPTLIQNFTLTKQ